MKPAGFGQSLEQLRVPSEVHGSTFHESSDSLALNPQEMGQDHTVYLSAVVAVSGEFGSTDKIHKYVFVDQTRAESRRRYGSEDRMDDRLILGGGHWAILAGVQVGFQSRKQQARAGR
jgi:hypothetical protein